MLGAGTDPTHIPGIDTVVSGEPEHAEPEHAEAEHTDEEPTGPLDTDDERPRATAAALAGDEDDEAPPPGPAFRVLDHRGSIVADGNGVIFRLDDTEARFRWNEIGAVEIGDARFGRRFEIAVCTTDRRRFDAEVIATSRKQRQEWAEELDAVLDAWFDDRTE